MSPEPALLSAIALDPTDPEPRLIYADWLEDHGAASLEAPLQRADFLRLHVQAGALARSGDAAGRLACVRLLDELRARLDGGWLDAVTRTHLQLSNNRSQTLLIVVEPWADEFAVGPGGRCEIVAFCDDQIPEDFTAHGPENLLHVFLPPGCTGRWEFWRDGELVRRNADPAAPLQ